MTCLQYYSSELIIVVASLWLQKCVLLDFYRHLLRHQPWEKPIMLIYLVIFTGSYIAIQIVTFTECDPFDHYWRVLPDPGSCDKAQVQLITVGELLSGTIFSLSSIFCLLDDKTEQSTGVLNILTDIMLLLMPIPILVKLRRSLWQYADTSSY